MAKRPHEYITPEGRVTTNSIEGFHGLALKYHGKKIDLHHLHYTCNTNMAICHKVIMNDYIVPQTGLYLLVFFYSEHWSTLEGHVFVEDGSGCTIPWGRGYPEGTYYLAEAHPSTGSTWI